VKFGIVGVWNTVFSFVINLACLKFFKAANILTTVVFGAPLRVYAANIIAWLISVFVSYMLNSRFVFSMEEGQQRSFWKSLLKSYVSYGFTGLILNNVLAMLWVGVLGIPEEIAPLISLVIAIPINFLMNKLWAFKTEDATEER
jgi:putative flippase GtrA